MARCALTCWTQCTRELFKQQLPDETEVDFLADGTPIVLCSKLPDGQLVDVVPSRASSRQLEPLCLGRACPQPGLQSAHAIRELQVRSSNTAPAGDWLEALTGSPAQQSGGKAPACW